MKEQGFDAGKIFGGNSQVESSRILYGESAQLFSSLIENGLPPGEYTLADFGSHSGELIQRMTDRLPGYKFETIAMDINQEDLERNPAPHRVRADIEKIPLSDKSTDITICRNTLAWNSPENQKAILKEMKRITKRIALIQHQGASSSDPAPLQRAANELFGGEIPRLTREEFFFSSPSEVEQWMKELGITFAKVQDRQVPGLSGLLVEKYQLSEEEASKARETLKGADYIQQATWLLNFDKTT